MPVLYVVTHIIREGGEFFVFILMVLFASVPAASRHVIRRRVPGCCLLCPAVEYEVQLFMVRTRHVFLICPFFWISIFFFTPKHLAASGVVL
uniref:Uncharacterized protein n=1 Tax=Anopheles darlingi TaxID=43151 RepID=A0A2M4DQT2_ANODA